MHVSSRLIERNDDPTNLYQTVDDLIDRYHQHLKTATYILLWRWNWKPDKDKHVILAKTRLADDFMRELREHDFSISLNHEEWPALQPNQVIGYLDRELCRIQPQLEKDDTQKMDDAGRPKWRLRRCDVQEFCANVRRHGAYSEPVRVFAESALNRKGVQAEPGSILDSAVNSALPSA